MLNYNKNLKCSITSDVHTKLDVNGVARELYMWAVDENLERIVRGLEPKPIDVLEIGTCNGISALIMSHIVNRVYTFDVAYRNAEYIWSFFPNQRKKIIAYAGPQHILDFTIADMANWTKAWGIKFDFAFIDGDHTYEGAKHDFELARVLGIKRILFHDVHGEGPEHSGVGKFTILELHARVIDDRKIYGYWEEI